MAPLAAFGFEIVDEGSELALKGRLQAGWGHRLIEDADAGYDRTGFFVSQARLELAGALERDLFFLFQLDLLPMSPVQTKVLWAGWEPDDRVGLRLGLMKTPYSWHQLQSSGKQVFIKGAEVVGDLGPGRDLGATADLHLASRKASFILGAFTGRGTPVGLDDPAGSPLVVARAQIMPLAAVQPGEGDVGFSEAPALSLALGAAVSDDRLTGEEDPEVIGLHHIDGRKLLWGGDAVLKLRGLFLSGEVALVHFTPREGPSWDGYGYVLMASYFIDVARLEPALRLDGLDPSDLEAEDGHRTLTWALNLYPTRSHSLKVMVDYRQRLPVGPGSQRWTEDDVMVTCQLAF